MSTRKKKFVEIVKRQRNEFVLTLFLAAGIIMWGTAIAYPSAFGGFLGFFGNLITIGCIVIYIFMYALKRHKNTIE